MSLAPLSARQGGYLSGAGGPLAGRPPFSAPGNPRMAPGSAKSYAPPRTAIPTLDQIPIGPLDGGPLSVASSARPYSPNQALHSPSSTVNLGTLDDGLHKQEIARKTRDLKLGTLETDVNDVTTMLRMNEKKMNHLADTVDRLNREVEEERSARRLLEKVLLKMAEEQTLKVVEKEISKERKTREDSTKKMKEYADLIHNKVVAREREAAGERQVTRAMMQMLAKTRRAVNHLAAEVAASRGDLEERIANDIINLNARCKDLQLSINHESMRASHECDGLRNTVASDMESLRSSTYSKMEEMNVKFGDSIEAISADVTALQAALKQEASDRSGYDEHLNAKLLETTQKLKDSLTQEMSLRAEDDAKRAKVGH